MASYIERFGVNATAWLYFAQMALVTSVVPRKHLLIMNVFDGHTSDAEHWRALMMLLNPESRPQPHELAALGRFYGSSLG